jgi:hypothetical protein
MYEITFASPCKVGLLLRPSGCTETPRNSLTDRVVQPVTAAETEVTTFMGLGKGKSTF